MAESSSGISNLAIRQARLIILLGEALTELLKYCPLSGDMALMIRACQGGGNEAFKRADTLVEFYSHLDGAQEMARVALKEVESADTADHQAI